MIFLELHKSTAQIASWSEFDLLERGWEEGGLTPHWLKMTPTLVTENFCLGVGFDLPSVPIQQDKRYMQMISKYGTFRSNF